MKKETKVIKKSISILTAILVVLGVSLICITCIKKEEDWYAKTYFDAVGIGYVFLYEVDTSGVTPVIRRDSGSFTPIKGANVTITTVLEGYHRWTSPVSETFTTDTNGRYQVRFIARTRRSNAISYQILMDGYFGFEGNPKIVSAAAVRNAQNNIVLIDTTRCNHWRR